jgi:hypothetical protein
LTFCRLRDSTIESYLESIRQAEAFLAGRRRTLLDARRADLEAFLGDLLQRRAPATAATRHGYPAVTAIAADADNRRPGRVSRDAESVLR